MKPDYKNWMPKGMILSFVAAAVAAAAVVCAICLFASGTAKTILLIVFGVLAAAFAALSVWGIMMYRAFSYDGKRQMSKQIIEGIAEYVKLPAGGKGLDVGCGSGALTIACAKRNPGASFVGLDRWGKEYASYNKPLCERNARAEGVPNVSFVRGDATNVNYFFDNLGQVRIVHN